ncbi:MAG: uracil phosphoribosyltransferase, partial [Treponema sp.]|nr:uracil phosphoribosyltransferase [Treponema sp.]
MENKIILKAEDLDGYLTAEDQSDLEQLNEMFGDTMKYFEPMNEAKIIEGYDRLGHEMQKICSKHPRIKVYSFETEIQAQAEASRVIAKLR